MRELVEKAYDAAARRIKTIAVKQIKTTARQIKTTARRIKPTAVKQIKTTARRIIHQVDLRLVFD